MICCCWYLVASSKARLSQPGQNVTFVVTLNPSTSRDSLSSVGITAVTTAHHRFVSRMLQYLFILLTTLCRFPIKIQHLEMPLFALLDDNLAIRIHFNT
jgi:hypothetical protein